MMLDVIPWNDHHYHLSFLPSPHKIENDFSNTFSPQIVNSLESPISMLQSEFERNLGNIYDTISIDISVKTRVVENIHVGSSCAIKEIQTYKALFQEFRDIFPGHMKKFQELIQAL